MFVFTLTLLLFIIYFSSLLIFRNNKLAILLAAPFVSIMCVLCFISHKEVLGYPVSEVWENMPEEINVVFFRRENDKLLLWIKLPNNSRLYSLPYLEQAEKALEEQRERMSKGIISKFKKSGKDNNQNSSQGQNGNNNSSSNRSGQPGQNNNHGRGSKWQYLFESQGEGIDAEGFPTTKN